MKTKRFLLAASFSLALASTVFSQEAIKFQIPTDSSGAIVPVVLPPTRPDTVQKLGIAANRPLDLQAISAKDTATFDTYSRRIALVQDSIGAHSRMVEAVKKNTTSMMPKFEPRDEFEKQHEFEDRKAKWEKELADRMSRDTKSLTQRIAELERAKKKIEENQISLYGSLSIKTTPEAAAIWLGREEIGATPAEYNYIIPGVVRVSVRKEGYNSWDTTLQAGPGSKFRFNIILEEKSIFSTENEINFVKILSKDTTVDGYKSRMKTIRERKGQVDAEIVDILDNFAKTYPTLEPQKPDETTDAFNKRRDSWNKGGMRKVAEFQRKHEAYKQKLDRSLAVLADYVVAAQSAVVSETMFAAKVELGTYDPDKEHFELVAQDTTNERSPFYFKGRIGIPRDTARAMNRAVPGLVANLQYINFPFATDSFSVNLAMSKLQLSRNGVDLKVEGSFGEIERYKSVNTYTTWKPRADSLLSGKLKPQGLDYAYAMGGKAPAGGTATGKDGSGFGWRFWTRVATYSLAAVFTGVAIYKHSEAQSSLDKLDDLKKNPSNTDSWINAYNQNADLVETRERSRNIYGISAGVLVLGGTATFFF